MRRHLAAGLLVGLAAVSAAGCGGGGESKDAPQKRFLVVTHSSLAGSISSKSDADLVRLGRQACAAFDKRQPSDQIVASMSANAEPGSEAFNSYAFLVVSAATELCPAHKNDVQGPLPTG